MKTNILRLMALLLACVLCVTPLCACGNNTEDPADGTEGASETAEPVETDPMKTLDNPASDFGGADFNVLSIAHDSLYTLLDVEKITGETVNDAIYERNRLIESMYNFHFHCESDIWQNTNSYLERQVTSGDTSDSSYDLVMLICRNAYAATLKNYLRNYDDLTYIDLDKDYYFRDVNEQFSICGRTFFAYGAESLNVLGQTNCLVFNKKIVENRDYGDLYALVNNKEWTYERLFTMCDDSAMDKNGDGRLTYGDDQMGLIGDYDLTIPACWVSAGCPLVTKDEDDTPTFSAKGDARFIQIVQESLNEFTGGSIAVYTANDGKEDAFIAGNSLFYSGCVNALHWIKAMPEDYGVLPWPMYDASQGRYYSRVVDGWIHVVPSTCTDPERTSIIMQALAYYSDKTVYDAYYSQALTAKYIRDEQSVDMLKLILSSMTIDLGDTVWYEKLRAPLVDEFRRDGGATKLASTLKSYASIAKGLVKDVTKFVDGLETK